MTMTDTTIRTNIKTIFNLTLLNMGF